ncbi:GlxA family transcriptional regulator [Terriglobus sp. 2YAB30_2]|uniref:GlxA family transcriptional regulator n=1 Tax=unclassified Terriglobus TaxID=2628988 RepID=UPI003F9CF94D
MKRPHQIGFVLYPQISTVNLAVSAVFEMANLHARYPAYEITLVSERGGLVETSVGSRIHTETLKRRSFDTILVAGEHDPSGGALPGVVKYLRAQGQRGVRIASVCTGTFVLAEAGLLDGRHATTHWYHAKSFRQQYPKVILDLDRIFTSDGSVWCSAGMSAGIDLALALVEQDFGREMARETAKLMVVYHRRAGGQSQHSTLLDLDATSDRMQTVLAYAKRNLAKPLSMTVLAKVAFLSPRQFSRAFKEETGQTPAKAVELLRVESARLMMEGGRFSVEEIARRNGFENRDRMRRSFLRILGLPPQAVQRTANMLNTQTSGLRPRRMQ